MRFERRAPSIYPLPMTVAIVVEPHPCLELAAFVTRTTARLAELPDVAAEATPPVATSDLVRTKVRDLLRAGGFKPSGRSKPAPEYLVGAAAEGRWPRINPLVDACNLVSLHSGLPISLVDLDRVTGALHARIAPAGTSYVFNPSGQTIDASGLLCLWDAEGPTGTPVKDAQRTKTHDDSRRVLAVIWGTRELPGRTVETERWYRALVGAIPGVVVEDVAVT